MSQSLVNLIQVDNHQKVQILPCHGREGDWMNPFTDRHPSYSRSFESYYGEDVHPWLNAAHILKDGRLSKAVKERMISWNDEKIGQWYGVSNLWVCLSVWWSKAFFSARFETGFSILEYD